MLLLARFFSGGTDESYSTSDASWLVNAKDDAKITLKYTCNDSSHGYWGILGWGASVDGNWVNGSSYSAAATATDTVTATFTAKELKNSLSISGNSQVSYLQLSAYNGGKIVSLSIADAATSYNDGINAGGTYMIQNVNSGLYLDAAGAKAANGTNVIQYEAAKSKSNNTWKLVPDGNGYYYIYSCMANGNSYFLDVSGNVNKNGTNIGIWQNSYCDAQLFKLVQNSDGSYSIYTKTSGNKKVVEVVNGYTTNNANVQQFEYNGHNCQKWYIMEATLGKSAPSKGKATVAPTVKPTVAPTVKPTAAPTVKPTATPTKAPTTSGSYTNKNGIVTKDNGVMRTNMTSFDLVDDMGIGINLGNTMESCGTWIDPSSVSNFETGWGAPITSQKLISGMKAAGYNTVRIPVAWSNMMADDGTYTINDAYFDRVETIMNYAFNEKMYVIVNMHYDSGWWARFGSTKSSEREEAMKKFKTMWTQIANRFKDYSDYLIFESANEELGHRLNSTLDYAGSGYYTTTEQVYDLMNKINQTFVDIVRASGGNNSTRHLLIAGYDTDIEKTCDSNFKMPKDTVDSRLTVSIHYYSPATYCLVEVEDNSWGYANDWGTASEIAAVKSDLSKMKNTFVDKGYPVIIGEYGVCDTIMSDGTTKRKNNRDKFFRTVCEYALNNGMVPVLWNISHVYDCHEYKVKNSVEASMFLEMKKLAESTGSYTPNTNKSTLEWSGTLGNSSWNPVAPIMSGDCDFTVSGLGGCYAISGVDWSQYKKMTLKSDGISGSVGYEFAKSANTSNQYWIYIENSQKNGTWTTSSALTLDVSDLNLSSGDTLYFRLNSENTQGKVKLILSK